METEVLVVGGGLSGLALARGLERSGSPFLLVEARDRVGGRVLSVPARSGSSPEDRYDLGPAWFWPGQPRMARLIRDLELRVFEQHSTGDLVFQDESGALERHPFSTMAGSLRIAGGFSRLTEGLAVNLPSARLLRGHVVAGLRLTSAGVRATVRRAGEELTIAAARVVLAIPPRLGARTVEFEPGLAPLALRAMAGIPTWMAGHTKVLATYRRPFWRGLGLSGDGISRSGPLAEIHDASPASETEGALFGFVGGLAASGQREDLGSASISQLVAMFGPAAGEPLDVLIQDWAGETHTATPADSNALASQHPGYGMPRVLADLWDGRLILASTELAPGFGGLLEGALEAAEQALEILDAEAVP